MSKHEQFPQVAQRKGAIVSESLRSLTKNEQMSESLIFLSESLICSFLGKKTSDSLGKPMSEFLALRNRRMEPGWTGYRLRSHIKGKAIHRK